MCEDKLEEIKAWIILTKTKAFGGIRPSDRARRYFAWLITEREKCKEYITELKEEIQDFIDRG